MSQPESFPNTTPPLESTPPTLNTSARMTGRGGEPTPSALPPLPTTHARFEVLRFHAKGGMGEVSVALDRELQREVAYKQIQPRFVADAEARRRFVLEAEVTGRLEHPGIVPIYGLGVQGDGRPYYAMRFIQGDSLRDAIAAFHEADQPGRAAGERERTLRGLLRRFVDVCNAVAFAHDRGWLHRDLKPANVMLGKFGETLVVDWGLARPLRTDSGEVRAAASVFPPSSLLDATEQTRQGDVVGTPPYMSPEQAQGDWDAVGMRSDVYSLGAILYEMLTGSVPFTGSLSEVLAAVKAGQLVPPRRRKAGVPAALEAVVTKAMAWRREERYATATELAAEVERWLADEPVQAHRESWRQRVRRWGKRHRALVTGLAVLLLTASLAVGVGFVLVTQALGRETREKQQKEEALVAASEQRNLALATVKAVIYLINRRLHDRPDMQELRQELLKEAEERLTKVAQAADTAVALNREQVVIHQELGDLFLQLEKGGVELARQRYEQMHALAVRLAEAEPDNALAQRDLSVALGRRGDVQLKLGNTQAALEAYRQYHALARRLAEAGPGTPHAPRDLAVTHNKLGDVWLQLGDTQAALDAYQQFHELARRLSEARPGDAEARRDLFVSLDRLGGLRLQLGDTRAALDACQQSQQLARRLVEEAPGKPQTRRDLSVSLDRLGDVRQRMGESAAALAAYRDALALRVLLLKDDPNNAVAQREVGVQQSKIGDVQLQQGDITSAVAAYRQGHTVLRRLAQANARNVEAQRDEAVILNRLGDGQLQLGDVTAALESYQQSLAIARRLVEADPRNAQARGDVLASCYKLGALHQSQHAFADAASWYDQALAVPKRFDKPAFFAKEVATIEPLAQLCRAADKALIDPASARPLPSALRLQVLSAILPALAKQKQRDKLLLVGELLAKEEKNPDALYNAACAAALCVPLTDKADDRERHAVRAVALLRRAVAAGYQDRAHLEKDGDLESLRQRADFQKLLQSLPAKPAP